MKSPFAPSREEIWRQLARDVGGQFHEAGDFTPFAVQARTGDWIITLNTNSHSHEGITTLRAPFFNPEKFRFTIYRAGIFSDVGKALGMQDIRVGHSRFDRDFVIKGNSPASVRRLFDNEEIRGLIDAQPRIHLSVQGREGVLSQYPAGEYPAGVDELYFKRIGGILDLAQLRMLFDLFVKILHQVGHEGGAGEDELRIQLRRLSAPGGRIRAGHVIYEGDEPRRDAAAALGRLGDSAAIPVLASVLGEKDGMLVVRAIDALAEIGHEDAIGPLVRWLGDTRNAADGRSLRDHVAGALRRLGAGEVVNIVLAALGGDFVRLTAYDGPHRAEIIGALGDAITWHAGTHPANALAEFRAVEALPRLREVLRNLGGRNPTGRAVSAAIRKLETRASLPRAAAKTDADTLPRAAREPGPDARTLPRGSQAPDP
ncbi:MAG: HEAT repeat domain-containing protein [Gemmatimonadetes bacterium]|nr:HEAT repeat domain-containing protein [Gemmatimonadota bacterium]